MKKSFDSRSSLQSLDERLSSRPSLCLDSNAVDSANPESGQLPEIEQVRSIYEILMQPTK